MKVDSSTRDDKKPRSRDHSSSVGVAHVARRFVPGTSTAACVADCEPDSVPPVEPRRRRDEADAACSCFSGVASGMLPDMMLKRLEYASVEFGSIELTKNKIYLELTGMKSF